MEIKESEQRAPSQAEVLKNALDEHSLELAASFWIHEARDRVIKHFLVGRHIYLVSY